MIPFVGGHAVSHFFWAEMADRNVCLTSERSHLKCARAKPSFLPSDSRDLPSRFFSLTLKLSDAPASDFFTPALSHHSENRMKRISIRHTLAACLLLGLSMVQAEEPDYPQFRGPERTGHSSDKNLLTQWPEGGPKLVWKSTGLGTGFSSASVAGDHVFTQGDQGREACYLYALDRKTGKQIWNLKLGRTGGNYSGPKSTPTVDGDYVYALGQFGDLVCAETKTGREVWRLSFTKDFRGRSGGWNYTESILIDGDQLICTPGAKDATVVALNKKTGETLWKCAIAGDGAAYSSPVIAEVGGIRHYVTLLKNSVVGVRAKDGELLWRYGQERFGGNTANIPTCIVKDNYVFASAGYGRGGALIELTEKDGKFDVKEIYFSRGLNNRHGGVILVGDYLYGDRDSSGRLFCAELKTGKVVWPGRNQTKGRGSASLTYADGHLYVRYSNGWMALVEANPEKYNEKSGFQIPNSDRNSWAHPVVVGGKMYLREKDVLWCYDVSK